MGPIPTATRIPSRSGCGSTGRSTCSTVELSHSTKVNYVEMGEGPPVLLVHGLGGAWQNWLENIPVLARNHRVIALDLPGFGDSPMPKWTINIRNYGSMVLDFIAALETGPVPVVGNSMGGFIAAEMSIRDEPADHQGRAGVRGWRLTYTDVPGADGDGRADVGGGCADDVPLSPRRAVPAAPAQDGLSQLFRDPSALRPELLAEFIRTGVNPPGFGDALIGLAGYDIHDRLAEVNDPVLIIWGRQDMIVPSADALAYSEMLQNSRLEIFNYCGHIPMAERPVRFNRLVERFLAE